ncbi:5-bromo-4-chloroindolyl phosphate hydrolysis family protein [Parageobacillus thermoglucosidasius]|uniref:5-bromo-4-chloroindolyl phosphate hydrolysis family protein n=1 Tax=Parageobacillus thermoglucosidasius TaxID=1426 RepID=UPI0001D18BE2|nr:5-bromo-4-chloroindolyl phosphate hydrolysis family protein [Parageobacillus thermoglucosidasius]AEH47585.1 5-bromo-4-chloroindolyl phosphate hydrolysis protein [Parageobacillus thermoglucosidasius C56-YS93]
MKRLLRTLWRWFVSWNVGVIVAVVTFFLADFHFFPSFFSGMGAMVVTSIIMKKRDGRIAGNLLKEEKAYIRSQLDEARKKWKQMRAARFRIRSLAMWQKISRICAVVDKMIRAVEQHPHQFRLAQSFFLNELPTAVTMIEKYVYLTNQPVRNQEMKETLWKTERLLDELSASAEQRLLEILSNDVFDLKVEAKLLEQSLEQQKLPETMEWRKENDYETVR